MAFFGRDYDRDYGREYGPGYGRGNWAGERSQWGRSGTPINESGWRAGGDPYYRRDRFSRYASDFDRGYDRGYKSRWQTDYGDPFGDRQQRTPMRVFDEESRANRGWETTYDRDYGSSPYPYGYRTWDERHGYDTGYSGRGYRGYPRRDTRWF